MTQKDSAEEAVHDIRRKTRRMSRVTRPKTCATRLPRGS
jgi:hypothetical protein